MNEKKYDPQDAAALSPEEQLDLLLEQFLNEPDPTEVPMETEGMDATIDIENSIAPEVDDTTAPSPEDQLDLLLASFMAEIEPEDEESPAIPALDLADLPTDSNDEPLPTELPALFSAEDDVPAEEKAVEETEMPEEEIFIPEEMEEPFEEDFPDEEEAAEETEMPEEEIFIPEEMEEPYEEDFPDQEEAAKETEMPAEETASDEDTSTNMDELLSLIAKQEADKPIQKPVKKYTKKQTNKPKHVTPAPTDSEESTTMTQPQEATQPEEDLEEDFEEYVGIMPDMPTPPKKRRPRNTKKYGFLGIPHMLTTLIWLGIIVFIGVGLGKFVWNCAADVLALGYPDSEVAITIEETDTLEIIADKLHKTGLIRYPSLFVIYGQISEAMDSINSGSYTLNTIYDYHALVDAMSSYQRRITTNVTIPEGYTCAQIFALLETKGVTTVEKLEAAAASGELGDYWFLEGVERGTANCLEGFLFPDTYTFYLDHDPVSVLQKFLNNFNKRFNDSMKIKLDTLNMTLAERMRANGLSEEYIAAHQMTVRDVVIVASLIEKETASNPESYNISSVIYNRLTKPDQYPYLQIDAALIYYTGRSEITAEDLITDHPYNTYTRKGLTIAGPISNPGSYSLDAALDPAESEYHFYALDPSTGVHHFSKTLKEHNDFLASLKKDEE